jgi:hypothetical protein
MKEKGDGVGKFFGHSNQEKQQNLKKSSEEI